MKVNSQRDIPFKSIYTNKALKRTLEFASDNGALLKASAVVGFSLLRPIAIMNTPDTDKENRKIATGKSITSSIIGFLMMFGISTPMAKSIDRIDKNPKKFLNKQTIQTLKAQSLILQNSKGYTFATQLFKLGLDTVVAIPKAILVSAGMPYIIELFKTKDKNIDSEESVNNISFKASPQDKLAKDKLAKSIGKIINKNWFQKFVNKYKDTNFPMHIMALTDTIATATFIQQTEKSKKIPEERKDALIYNSAFSTGLCIAGGYGIDKLLDKPTENFIKNYRKFNAKEKNLEKQIQGIKITKPILILGTIYYIIIPFISTFLAEKADKRFDKKDNFKIE